MERHAGRMRELVKFTASSLDTDFPSPFGSSIYDDSTGECVAQAYDTVMREGDPTNHGEMNAIRLATRSLGRLSLRGFTLYSTCEPCPMCMSASIWAEVNAVVFGASTMEDATKYWPQPSKISPQELVAQTITPEKVLVVPHVERELCVDLFNQVDALRVRKGLDLPPHRV
jgi:tRNA(Arg) A34 adenosine deaminase TadA